VITYGERRVIAASLRKLHGNGGSALPPAETYLTYTDVIPAATTSSSVT
jgi:hypothetical protein